MSAHSKPILPNLSAVERESLAARLESNIDRSGGPDACHPWTGGSFLNGYAITWCGSTAANRRMVKAHRAVYELATGDSPPTVDHLCHDSNVCLVSGPECPHRRCCNLRHLGPKTIADNASRAHLGIHRERCKAGHRMDGDNVYIAPSGGWRCRTCAADLARNSRQEAQAQRAPHERKRRYRPRGMGPEQLVDWLLATARRVGGCLRLDPTSGGGGYASIRLGDRMVAAHRLVFEVKVRKLRIDEVIDHICHDPRTCDGGLTCPHRACIRPDHLTAKTNAENVAPARAARKVVTECIHGHAFTPENTYTDKRGARHCRACACDRACKSAKKEVDGRRRADPSRCSKGHDLALSPRLVRGWVKCGTCANERNQEYKARKREKALNASAKLLS